MKRLLAQIGITYFSVLAAVFYFSEKITCLFIAVFLAAALLLFFLRKFHKRIYLPVMALAAALACVSSAAYTAFFVSPLLDRFSGKNACVEAVLTDEASVYHESYCYPLKVTGVDGEKTSFHMMLVLDYPLDADVSDSVSFDGTLTTPYADLCDYYRSKGVYLFCYDASGVSAVRAPRRSLYFYAIEIREKSCAVFDSLLPYDDAALCKALLIGDRSALRSDIRSDFRYSGVSYLIVVSGMHFAILTAFCLTLFKKVFRNRYVYLTLTAAFTLLYMAVTGFSPTVMRSGIMMLLMILARLMRRRPYPKNSLGFAGLLIPLIFSPDAAGDVGLMLSFSATFAILTWAPPIYEKIRIRRETKGKFSKRIIFLLNRLLGLISVSLAANILAFPISVFVFRGFSLVTLLSSVLLYLEVWLMVILSFFVCIFWFLGPLRILSVLLSWILYPLCEAVLFLVHLFGSWKFSYVKVGAPYLYLWLILTAVLAAVAYLLCRNYRLMKYVCLISLTVLLGGALSFCFLTADEVSLFVFDGGGKNAVALSSADRLMILDMDCPKSAARSAVDTLSYDFSSAETAVCSSEREKNLLSSLSGREFAISRFLEYDDGEEASASANADFFTEPVRVDFSDEVTTTVGVTERGLYHYVAAREKTALVMERGVCASDIPAPYRSADVIVANTVYEDFSLLSCDTLVLTSSRPLAEIAASGLTASYQRVIFSAESDVRLLLSD